MTLDRRQPREIEGKGKTVRELLAGRKYSIDYYQREYKWQTKQVAELIDDLSAKFLESHEAGHERAAVAEYGHYFLGSIIVEATYRVRRRFQLRVARGSNPQVACQRASLNVIAATVATSERRCRGR